MFLQHNHKAAQMRAWIKRRADKGITATSDDIWAHINKRWPELNENEREYIWQEAEQVPIARERARLAAKMAQQLPPGNYTVTIDGVRKVRNRDAMRVHMSVAGTDVKLSEMLEKR